MDNTLVVKRNLQDFQKVFAALRPDEQAQALQCLVKQVTAYPEKLVLDVYELTDFSRGSQDRQNWLPG